MNDISKGQDGATVSAKYQNYDFANWNIYAVVDKWSEEAVDWARGKLGLRSAVGQVSPIPVSSLQLFSLGIGPEVTIESPGNLLLNAGIQRLEDLLIGAGGTAFNNANTRLGVGNSATAEVASQTDLQAGAGGSNRQFKLMNATFPSRATQVVTFQADFLTGEANFVWNEWGIDNGTGTGTTVTAPMLNRKVASLGTKASGTWTLTATLTIS